MLSEPRLYVVVDALILVLGTKVRQECRRLATPKLPDLLAQGLGLLARVPDSRWVRLNARERGRRNRRQRKRCGQARNRSHCVLRPRLQQTLKARSGRFYCVRSTSTDMVWCWSAADVSSSACFFCFCVDQKPPGTGSVGPIRCCCATTHARCGGGLYSCARGDRAGVQAPGAPGKSSPSY